MLNVHGGRPILPLVEVATAADPAAIFAKAQHALHAAPYPRSLRYVVHVQVNENGTSRDAHYNEQCNVETGRVFADPISDEERTSPHVAQGVNVKFHLGATMPLGRPDTGVDYLGVPQLSPVYSFGILDVDRRDYDITLAGTERIGSHTDYHLSLHPARLSYKLRLREIWIDRKTSAIDRVVTHGNFTGFQYFMSNWTTDFTHVRGVTYIDQETTDAPMRVDGHTYSGATIYFENVRPAPFNVPVLAGFSARHILEEPDW